MKLRDAKQGERVVLIERMPDDQLRHTFYERGSKEPCMYDYNVQIARLRTMQYRPNGSIIYDSGDMYCTDPGEALGDIVVHPAEMATPPART